MIWIVQVKDSITLLKYDSIKSDDNTKYDYMFYRLYYWIVKVMKYQVNGHTSVPKNYDAKTQLSKLLGIINNKLIYEKSTNFFIGDYIESNKN